MGAKGLACDGQQSPRDMRWKKVSATGPKPVICPAEEFRHECHTGSVWFVMMSNQEGDEP